jgi:DNA ligase (NAD+)
MENSNYAIENKLVDLLTKYNKAYRAGEPLVSDSEYDLITEELRELNPEHVFLHSVEEEEFAGKKEVNHPEPMLSTQKFYIGKGSLDNWTNNVKAAYEELGIEGGKIRVTAKLDGLAGMDYGHCLATRGNGSKGFDVSKIFDFGVVPVGGRGLGVGEIVLSKEYFDTNLKEIMSHPRNVVGGIVGSDNTLNPDAKKALDAGAVQFMPYSQLEAIFVEFDDLEDRCAELLEYFQDTTDFYIDGIVAEADNREVYEHMGYTGHHRKSQIAIKTIGETSTVEVVSVEWQVGRTRITPVINIKPTNISGAMVSKLSGHHAGNIKEQQIGKGAKGLAVRAGEVIPTWLNTIQPSDNISVPCECPSCNTPVVWVGDFIECQNSSCDGKAESNLRHFIGNMEILLFGKRAIEILVSNGFTRPSDLFSLTYEDYKEMGFGDKQSENFIDSIKTTLKKEIPDTRFVASWGVSNLGKGDSRKILEHMSISDLIKADKTDISSLFGFAEKSSRIITEGIQKNITEIEKLIALGLNLKVTQTNTEKSGLALFGEKIVFTGKVNTPRKELKEMALTGGADVQSGVNKKTTILVAGESAGSKLKKAEDLGVKIISEEDFLEMVR